MDKHDYWPAMPLESSNSSNDLGVGCGVGDSRCTSMHEVIDLTGEEEEDWMSFSLQGRADDVPDREAADEDTVVVNVFSFISDDFDMGQDLVANGYRKGGLLTQKEAEFDRIFNGSFEDWEGGSSRGEDDEVEAYDPGEYVETTMEESKCEIIEIPKPDQQKVQVGSQRISETGNEQESSDQNKRKFPKNPEIEQQTDPDDESCGQKICYQEQYQEKVPDYEHDEAEKNNQKGHHQISEINFTDPQIPGTEECFPAKLPKVIRDDVTGGSVDMEQASVHQGTHQTNGGHKVGQKQGKSSKDVDNSKFSCYMCQFTASTVVNVVGHLQDDHQQDYSRYEVVRLSRAKSKERKNKYCIFPLSKGLKSSHRVNIFKSKLVQTNDIFPKYKGVISNTDKLSKKTDNMVECCSIRPSSEIDGNQEKLGISDMSEQNVPVVSNENDSLLQPSPLQASSHKGVGSCVEKYPSYIPGDYDGVSQLIDDAVVEAADHSVSPSNLNDGVSQVIDDAVVDPADNSIHFSSHNDGVSQVIDDAVVDPADNTVGLSSHNDGVSQVIDYAVVGPTDNSVHLSSCKEIYVWMDSTSCITDVKILDNVDSCEDCWSRTEPQEIIPKENLLKEGPPTQPDVEEVTRDLTDETVKDIACFFCTFVTDDSEMLHVHNQLEHRWDNLYGDELQEATRLNIAQLRAIPCWFCPFKTTLFEKFIEHSLRYHPLETMCDSVNPDITTGRSGKTEVSLCHDGTSDVDPPPDCDPPNVPRESPCLKDILQPLGEDTSLENDTGAPKQTHHLQRVQKPSLENLSSRGSLEEECPPDSDSYHPGFVLQQTRHQQEVQQPLPVDGSFTESVKDIASCHGIATQTSHLQEVQQQDLSVDGSVTDSVKDIASRHGIATQTSHLQEVQQQDLSVDGSVTESVKDIASCHGIAGQTPHLQGVQQPSDLVKKHLSNIGMCSRFEVSPGDGDFKLCFEGRSSSLASNNSYQTLQGSSVPWLESSGMVKTMTKSVDLVRDITENGVTGGNKCLKMIENLEKMKMKSKNEHTPKRCKRRHHQDSSLTPEDVKELFKDISEYTRVHPVQYFDSNKLHKRPRSLKFRAVKRNLFFSCAYKEVSSKASGACGKGRSKQILTWDSDHGRRKSCSNPKYKKQLVVGENGSDSAHQTRRTENGFEEKYTRASDIRVNGQCEHSSDIRSIEPSEHSSDIMTVEPSEHSSDIRIMGPYEHSSDIMTVEPTEHSSDIGTMEPYEHSSDTMTVEPSEHSLDIMTVEPSEHSSDIGTIEPSEHSSDIMTVEPSEHSSDIGTMEPSEHSSDIMTVEPSEHSSDIMTVEPSEHSSDIGTMEPSEHSSDIMTVEPSEHSSDIMTVEPSEHSSDIGTMEPSEHSSDIMTVEPSEHSSDIGTMEPSEHSSDIMTAEPSEHSSDIMTVEPSEHSSDIMTVQPSEHSSDIMAVEPSEHSSDIGTIEPSGHSSDIMTVEPSEHSSDIRTIEASEHSSDIRIIGPSEKSSDMTVESSKHSSERTIEASEHSSYIRIMGPYEHSSDIMTVEPSEHSSDIMTVEPSEHSSDIGTMEPSEHSSDIMTVEPSEPSSDTMTVEPTEHSSDIRKMGPSEHSSDFRMMGPTKHSSDIRMMGIFEHSSDIRIRENMKMKSKNEQVLKRLKQRHHQDSSLTPEDVKELFKDISEYAKVHPVQDFASNKLHKGPRCLKFRAVKRNLFSILFSGGYKEVSRKASGACGKGRSKQILTWDSDHGRRISCSNPKYKKQSAAGENVSDTAQQTRTTSKKGFEEKYARASDIRTMKPSEHSSDIRMMGPSQHGSDIRTIEPSRLGSDIRTIEPSRLGSDIRMMGPYKHSSDIRTKEPSQHGSDIRTMEPSQHGSDIRTIEPSQLGSDIRMMGQYKHSSDIRTIEPSRHGSDIWTMEPSQHGSDIRTIEPTRHCSDIRMIEPSGHGSDIRTMEPSRHRSDIRTMEPSLHGPDIRRMEPSLHGSDIRTMGPFEHSSDIRMKGPSQLGSDIRMTGQYEHSSDRTMGPSQLGSDIRTMEPTRHGSDIRPMGPCEHSSDIRTIGPSENGSRTISLNQNTGFICNHEQSRCQPRKRGTQPSQKMEEEVMTDIIWSHVETENQLLKTKRGRPRKNRTSEYGPDVITRIDCLKPKARKRGRPPKLKVPCNRLMTEADSSCSRCSRFFGSQHQAKKRGKQSKQNIPHNTSELRTDADSSCSRCNGLSKSQHRAKKRGRPAKQNIPCNTSECRTDVDSSCSRCSGLSKSQHPAKKRGRPAKQNIPCNTSEFRTDADSSCSRCNGLSKSQHPAKKRGRPAKRNIPCNRPEFRTDADSSCSRCSGLSKSQHQAKKRGRPAKPRVPRNRPELMADSDSLRTGRDMFESKQKARKGALHKTTNSSKLVECFHLGYKYISEMAGKHSSGFPAGSKDAVCVVMDFFPVVDLGSRCDACMLNLKT